MKSKLKALLGIGLTLVLLTSLMVGLVVPAGAAPAKLKFSTLTLPKVGDTGDYWAYPGSDVGPIAIAADGDILFAAVEKSGWDVMKSSDGGYSWKMLDDFRDEAAADTSDIVDVAVSPDYEEDLTVFVATEDFLYQSVDGGKNFIAMTTGWADTETITDLDVALDDRGRLAIMVGTSADVVLVTLEVGVEAGTAEWSTAEKHSGSYSAKMTVPAGGTWSDSRAQVKMSYGRLLSTVTNAGLTYWYSYNGVAHNSFVRLDIDADGNGIRDHCLCSLKQDSTVYDGTWTKTLQTDSWQIYTIDEDSGDVILGDWKTLTDWQADTETFPAATTMVMYLLVKWSSPAGAGEGDKTIYIDDITIGGVTYYLEDDPDPEADLEKGVAYTLLGDVYVLSTATGMSWQPQGIGDYDVLACAFSPFFADDEGISAVVTDVDKTRVRFSIANTAEGGGWGEDIADAKVQDAKGNDYSSQYASIAFPDDFDPWGIGNNICFVGIDATDTEGTELGDVYKIVLKEGGFSSAVDLDIRGVITTLLPTATNIVSIDVCGDAEEANIIVGTDYCSLVSTPAYFLTYRSDDGGDSWIPSGTKSPTGGDGAVTVFTNAETQVLMSPDFLTDEIAYAATTGPGTSAFSRTKDSGATWNQIGLIDYGHETNGYTVKDLDAAGYNAEGTLHMTTWEPETDTNGAVWNRTDGKNWERIWSYANPGVTSNIKELIISSDETMFAVDYDAKYIWRSSDNGATWPKKITTKADLSEVVIVSPTTLYTGHTDGSIWWSTKSGTGWTKPDDSEIPATVIPYMVVVGDKVLIGSEDGKVFVSSDGGETIEKLGLTNPGDPGDVALPQQDLGFADNNIIYCTLAGTLDGGVWRCEVDWDDPSSSEWERIDDSTLQPSQYDPETVIATAPAIALPPSGVLYVTDGAGGLWRSANPTADVDGVVPPYFEKETKGLDPEALGVGLFDLDVFPTVIFCSAAGEYYEQVVMFTDTLDTGVTLADPADKAAGVGLIAAGTVKPLVTVAWEAMAGATSYQYQVAYDSEFKTVVEKDFTTSLLSSMELVPNKTYYWRVRVANETEIGEIEYLIGAPLISPWSDTWKFKTAIGATMARPDLEAPAAGEIDIALRPTFEWSGIAWAEKYEFELATGPGTTAGGYFASTLVSLTGTNALVSTAWKCDIDLDYEGRYYWHVKAIGVDTETPWSDVGTFVTMAKPVLPPEPTAPVEIPPVEEITPAWIWAIIGIGAVLVIAVVVLIVTTRRVP